MSTPARCPSCGFGYAWDGERCSHCHFPLPDRSAWFRFDQLELQLARYHADPDPTGLAWFAAGCLRRDEALIEGVARTWLDQIEAHLADPLTTLSAELIHSTGHVYEVRDPTPGEVLFHGVLDLARGLAGTDSLTPEAAFRVAAAPRHARGLERYPHRSLETLPLPAELEPYRSVAIEEAAVTEMPAVGRGGPPNDRLASRRIRYEQQKYEGQRRGVEQMEEAAQCHLYRDVFGYPFEPVPFPAVWRTQTVAWLADAVFAYRAFDRLPILADALEEAGCDDPRILTHCREPEEHVRGCWVVERCRSRPGE